MVIQLDNSRFVPLSCVRDNLSRIRVMELWRDDLNVLTG